jgi:hypothetical protein
MIDGYDREHLYVEMYNDVKRTTNYGSLANAIKAHAQACGFVAYAFDIHPDEVALAVKYDQQVKRGVTP